MDNQFPWLLLAAAIGAAWLWLAHRRRRHAAETELRRICMGNEQQTERLIEAEMIRAPEVSRAEAARRAVERYRRDNR